MEKREFIISYGEGSWALEIKGWKEEMLSQPYRGDVSKIKDYPFGQGSFSPQGLWIYMFDVDMKDEYIEMAKEDELMQEVCDFQLRNSDFKFTGTFVDAFKYIKKMQEECRNKAKNQ